MNVGFADGFLRVTGDDVGEDGIHASIHEKSFDCVSEGMKAVGLKDSTFSICFADGLVRDVGFVDKLLELRRQA